MIEHSPEINEIATALSAAQGEIPAIGYDKTVKVSTKTGGTYTYSYTTLARIWEVIRSVLPKHGLAVIQTPGEHDDRLSMTTLITHTSGQWIRGTFAMPKGGYTPQEVGSLITYARRYQLSPMLGIATEEDEDGTIAQNAAPAPRSSERPPAGRKPHLEPARNDVEPPSVPVTGESGQNQHKDAEFAVTNDYGDAFNENSNPLAPTEREGKRPPDGDIRYKVKNLAATIAEHTGEPIEDVMLGASNWIDKDTGKPAVDKKGMLAGFTDPYKKKSDGSYAISEKWLGNTLTKLRKDANEFGLEVL